MVDFINIILGTLLRAAYLFPFFNYYLIANREKKFLFNNSQKIILYGICLAVIHMILLIVFNVITYMGIFSNYPDMMLLVQVVSNILMSISYAFLLTGMYQLYRKGISRHDFINIAVIILSVSTALIALTENFLFKLSIVTYVLGTYFLINSLIITSFILKEHEKNYYLIIIGTLILIIDPLLYINANINMLKEFPNLINYYLDRQISYLIGVTAMILIVIPNIKFLLKIAKKEFIGYTSEDTLVENTIKRIINETQTIYGSVALNLLETSKMQFMQEYGKKAEYTGALKFKNLTYTEQKEFLKALLKTSTKVLSKDLLTSIINNIIDNDNEGIINECLPREELRIKTMQKRKYKS